MTPTRRDFIKFVVAGAVTSGCPFNLELLAQSAEKRAIVGSEEHTICHQVRDLMPSTCLASLPLTIWSSLEAE